MSNMDVQGSWENVTGLWLELTAVNSDDRPTFQRWREAGRAESPVVIHGPFRLVDAAGDEVQFPLALVGGTRFSSDHGRDLRPPRRSDGRGNRP